MNPIKIFVDTTAPTAPLTLPQLDETLMSEGQVFLIVDQSNNAATNNQQIDVGSVSDSIILPNQTTVGTITLDTDNGLCIFTAQSNNVWTVLNY